jgi:superkiller protein 3
MLGLAAWRAGDPAQAERALCECLRRDPDHVKGHVNLARVLLDDRRPREALAAIQGAVMKAADTSDVLRVQARCHDELSRWADAEIAYKRALHLDPRDAWSFNNLGLIYIRQERFDEALGSLACAVSLRDDVAVFHNNLGVALERTGHALGAAEAYARALEIDRAHPTAAHSLARVEDAPSDPRAARADLPALAAAFRRAVGSQPADTSAAPSEAGSMRSDAAR